MSPIDIAKLSSAIGRQLRSRRSAVGREEMIHDAIAAAFVDLGIVAEREHRLSAAARLDFYIAATKTAVEVKKDVAGFPVLAQVGRYFESPDVSDCILIAMRIDPKLPTSFQGKPIAHVALWKFLL